ncbi:MAG: hypothetical protein IVW56_03465 [Candidatus Binataceae bacterium]|nr:hypothetical protein [Candidatus Binataceae bacterium]
MVRITVCTALMVAGAIAPAPPAARAAKLQLIVRPIREGALPGSPAIAAAAPSIAISETDRAVTTIRDRRFAQNDDSGADTDIAPDQVQKYIAVYKDMQRDRGLTVEQAASREGLTLSAFRALERKIERDEPTREHVRAELQSAAAAAPTPVTAK